jgi:hypothetical protein
VRGWKWDPSRLGDRDRIALARVGAVAARYGHGNAADAPRAEALAALREICTDPVVLGIAAGAHLVDPYGYKHRAVDLLREVGADMTVAQEHAAELRAWYDRSQYAPS